MTVTIHVTEADIAAGVPDNPRRCPLALAIQRTLCAPGVHVATRVAYLARDPENRQAPLPESARAFRRQFDRAQGGPLPETCKPFSFELCVDDLVAAPEA